MSFEGQMDFSLAVAQIRAHRILDLIVKRGAGMYFKNLQCTQCTFKLGLGEKGT